MMDDKMRAAFDAWAVRYQGECGHYPDAYAGSVWTLDYLRTQQEPVAWGDVKVRQDGKRYCRAIATTDQSNLGYSPLFAHPVPPLNLECKSVQARLAAQWGYVHPVPLSVPEGWQLVPVRMTDTMLRAARNEWLDDPMRRTTTMWAAALATAPKQGEK